MRNRRRSLLFVLLMGLCVLNWLAPAAADEPADCKADCGGGLQVECTCTGSGATCSAVDRDEHNKVRGGCEGTDSNGCLKVENCKEILD